MLINHDGLLTVTISTVLIHSMEKCALGFVKISWRYSHFLLMETCDNTLWGEMLEFLKGDVTRNVNKS